MHIETNVHKLYSEERGSCGMNSTQQLKGVQERTLKNANRRKPLVGMLKENYQLYLMLLIPVALVIIFCYIPMYGAQIAFKNFGIVKGIWDSPWVGLKWFEKFVTNPMFLQTMKNTLTLSLYSLLMGFPFSVLLALGLNYISSKFFKKTVQMISYAPNFISVVVMTGIMFQLFNPLFGVIGQGLSLLAGQSVDIFLLPESFRHSYVWSGVWQGVGFGSIIYISSLASVSPELHEAAVIDGASIPQRIIHIDIPGILPTIIVQLILSTGGLLNTGFEKVLLFQNTFNLQYSEVIDTYAYKVGLASQMPNYSYGAAIGLFKSIVCFIMLVAVNKIAQKISDSSLW